MVFQKSFTNFEAYTYLFRGHIQSFELTWSSKTHRVLPGMWFPPVIQSVLKRAFPNGTVWRLLRKRLHLKAYKLLFREECCWALFYMPLYTLNVIIHISNKKGLQKKESTDVSLPGKRLIQQTITNFTMSLNIISCINIYQQGIYIMLIIPSYCIFSFIMSVRFI
jgi:hypothetical protein